MRLPDSPAAMISRRGFVLCAVLQWVVGGTRNEWLVLRGVLVGTELFQQCLNGGVLVGIPMLKLVSAQELHVLIAHEKPPRRFTYAAASVKMVLDSLTAAAAGHFRNSRC